MLRVIHITHQPVAYGTGTFLASLLLCQKSRYPDLRVGVAFDASGPLMAAYHDMGLPVHCLGLSTARDPRVFTRLRRLCGAYDIVNLHSYSPWAFLAAKAARKKVVYTFHGAFGIRNGRLHPLLRIYHRTLINRHCDRVTFASTSSLSIYEAMVGSAPSHGRAEVFPYGTSVDGLTSTKDSALVRRELGLAGCFVVGTAARMDPVKRIERLIEAFALLPGDGASRLVIMGAGDTGYETALRERVHRHQMDDRVLFLGYRQDAIDVIGALDMFVLPSKGETFGLALLEAMALGIPSAVFQDAGGSRDILGQSGFVVDNVAELSEAMRAIREDRILKETISQNVRLRSRLFDIAHTADNLHRVYQSL